MCVTTHLASTRTLYRAGVAERKPPNAAGAAERSSSYGFAAAERTTVSSRAVLTSIEVRRLQEIMHCLRVHPERPADPHRGQFAVVHQAVHRHLADPHEAGHLGDGEKLSPRRLVGSRVVTCLLPARRIPPRWPVHRRHRNPILQARAVPAASPPLGTTPRLLEENSVVIGVIATGVG